MNFTAINMGYVYLCNMMSLALGKVPAGRKVIVGQIKEF